MEFFTWLPFQVVLKMLSKTESSTIFKRPSNNLFLKLVLWLLWSMRNMVTCLVTSGRVGACVITITVTLQSNLRPALHPDSCWSLPGKSVMGWTIFRWKRWLFTTIHDKYLLTECESNMKTYHLKRYNCLRLLRICYIKKWTEHSTLLWSFNPRWRPWRTKGLILTWFYAIAPLCGTRRK